MVQPRQWFAESRRTQRCAQVCLLPHNIMRELMEYIMWLVRESTQSARKHGAAFLGMAFQVCTRRY
jgi:hypothetical protein